MDDFAIELTDVDAYMNYAQLLKKKKVSKSLMDLGFTPIRYPWNRLGKVQGLRAIVPSSSAHQYDAILKVANSPVKRQRPKSKKRAETSPLVPQSDNLKYTWDLEGHKVLAESYEKFVAGDNDKKLKSTKGFESESIKRPLSANPDRIIEKTEQAMKKHLESLSREKIQPKMWSPSVYPSTTYSTKKNAEVLPAKAIHNWPEYEHVGYRDVLVTIEHCTNCKAHSLNTHHNEQHYLKMADAVQMCLTDAAMQFDINFRIILKPISLETHIHPPERAQELLEDHTFHAFRPTADVIDTVTTSLRTGAFEVQVAFRDPTNHIVVHLLHSKLFRGEWPKKKALVSRFEKLLLRVGKFRHANLVPLHEINPPQPHEDVGLHPDVNSSIIHHQGTNHGDQQVTPGTSHVKLARPVSASPKVKSSPVAKSDEPTVTRQDITGNEVNHLPIISSPVIIQSYVPDVATDADEAAIIAMVKLDQPPLSPANPTLSLTSHNASWIEGNVVDIGSLIFEGSLESNHTPHIAESSVGSGEATGDDFSKFLTAAKSEEVVRRNTIAILKSRSQSGGSDAFPIHAALVTNPDQTITNASPPQSAGDFKKLDTFDDDDIDAIVGDDGDEDDTDFNKLYDTLALA